MRNRTLLAMGLVASLAGFARAETPTELATQAQKVLQTNCHRCHGQNGAIEGGMNYILDLTKLVGRKKVVPGALQSSPVYRRMLNGSMPPAGENPRPSEADIAVIRQWIEAGAPTAEVAKPETTRLSTQDVQNLILADLDTFDRRTRRFQRYFTLTHLANAGLSDDELQTYRNALTKLINSLSWHPKVRAPEAIDPGKTILRIDLRWYMWDAVLWNRILADYPYGVLEDSAAARAVIVGTGSKMPTVRADWFTAAASRAPLYYDVLQLPGNLGELERQLRIDAPVNIQQERVIRVGFNGSGISRFNRILERHDSVHGAYWRTYDFDEVPQNLVERGGLLPDRRNIFAFPLGPGLVETPFTHAGGEAIFALPNGLHAFMLVNNQNTRLDKGPINIVSDPKRPDRAVEAGVSCMSCHLSGINPKADQVRDHLDKNPKAFSRGDADLIRGLYPPKDKSLAVMEEDAKKYAEALAKTGSKVSKYEPVSTITLRYEADLDLLPAAAEVGLTAEEFKLRIDASPILTKNLGALRVAGGTVSRAVWLQTFGDLTRDLRLGTLFQAGLNGGLTADNIAEADPLESVGNVANQVVFTLDGKRAVIASGDRSVRVWDVEGRRDLKRLIGHTASVWAVALSVDETRVLSGSADGTMRLWDLKSGQELKVMIAHLGLVTGVAFTGDGTKAISVGYDGTAAWWDLVTNKELRRLEGEAKAIHAVDLHPKQPYAVLAADKSIIVWNTRTGAIVNRWEAHAAAVTCVKFAEAGNIVITGADDGQLRVWETNSGRRILNLDGHEAGIRGVALKPGGRWLLSAASDRTLRLWDLSTKKVVATFRKHDASVVSTAFAPSGLRTLSIDRDLNFLLWDVEKFLTGTATTELVRPDPPERIPPAKP